MPVVKGGRNQSARIPVSRCPAAAMAPRSAAMLTVFPMANRLQASHSSQAG